MDVVIEVFDSSGRQHWRHSESEEATASEKDMPEWGPQDERGIDMEVETAAADLAAGSDAVILRHPESVKTISKLIKALA